jgi:vacuolar-type H+-ATPase subunit F/Vma7
MPSMTLSREECGLLLEGMKDGIEQAEEAIKAFKADAKSEDVTAILVARSLMMMIKQKMEMALTVPGK